MTTEKSDAPGAQLGKKSEDPAEPQRNHTKGDRHHKVGTKGSEESSRTHGGAIGTSSLIMQLVGSVVGDNLQDTISSVKSKVMEQMAVHGPEYLDSAKAHVTEAMEKVVSWAKKHPLQAVAAATALVSVSAFLYVTLRSREATDASAREAKGST